MTDLQIVIAVDYFSSHRNMEYKDQLNGIDISGNLHSLINISNLFKSSYSSLKST